jgi:hypothetical protein
MKDGNCAKKGLASTEPVNASTMKQRGTQTFLQVSCFMFPFYTADVF